MRPGKGQVSYSKQRGVRAPIEIKLAKESVGKRTLWLSGGLCVSVLKVLPGHFTTTDQQRARQNSQPQNC